MPSSRTENNKIVSIYVIAHFWPESEHFNTFGWSGPVRNAMK